MKSLLGRLFGLSLAFIIALSALLPMVGAGNLATSQIVPMPPGDFILYKADHFDFYYDSTRITDVSEAVIDAEAAYSRVTAFFGPYDHRVRVILAANHLQYTVILNQDSLPESDVGSGWGDAERGTIVIESPDQLDNFSSVLAHELTHIVMRTKLIDHKYDVPEWFSEGLAIYVSGDMSNTARAAVEQGSRNNKLMTVSQMEDIHERSTDVNTSVADLSLAYAQSGMLVEYITQQYSDDTIRLILQDFGPNGDLDKAFLKRTGYTPEDLNAGWKMSFKSELSVKDGLVLNQRVYGYVTEAGGKPIANETLAFVCMRNDSVVFGKSYTVITNKSGYYILNLTYGPFNVHLDKPGFTTIDNNITLQKGESRLYNVTMLSKQVAANTMTVGTEEIDNSVLYIVLGVVNLAALALLAFVFWRTKK